MRLLFFVIFSFLAAPALCQEKYFKDAISRGPGANGFYFIDNPKRKSISEYELRQYAKSKGYLEGRVKTIDVTKLGRLITVVDTFEFHLGEDYDAYVYTCFTKSNATSLPKNKGAAYMLPWSQRIRSGSVTSTTWTNKKTLTHIEDIYWTGQVVHGTIHGKGAGFYMKKDNYYYFTGNFSHGFATENITIQSIHLVKNRRESFKSNFIDRYETPEVDSKVLGMFAGHEDPLLREAVDQRLMENSGNAVAQLEESLNKAKLINISNYSKYSKDYFPEQFCNRFKTVVDQKTMEKADELRHFNNVLAGLNAPIRSKWYDESSVLTQALGGYKTKWDQKTVDYVETVITKGIESCKTLKSSSKLGFRNFCIQAEKLLAKKKTDFTSAVAKGKAEYNRIHSDEYAAKQEEWSKYEKYQKELSQQIDWERSKSPSGGLSYHLLGVYDYCVNEGEVRFKAGTEYVKYNAYYYHDKLDHYGITHATSKIESKLKKKEFKTESEMYEAIVNALK